jgi:hypothetical protein
VHGCRVSAEPLGPKGKVVINPNWISTFNVQNWTSVLSHEFGHDLGVADLKADTGCTQTSAVMFESYNPNGLQVSGMALGDRCIYQGEYHAY